MAQATFDHLYPKPLRLTLSVSIEIDGPESVLQSIATGVAEVIDDLA